MPPNSINRQVQDRQFTDYPLSEVVTPSWRAAPESTWQLMLPILYLGTPKYRMGLSNPLLLENVLVKHPKLRVFVSHAGWPMLDQMIGLLYAHPRVYVDAGVIDWYIPKSEFHAYLR
jgi:predicted TIM-barrel fold metal-dependent hydrolase